MDEYNKAAETYNETVDKEYEAAVEEVNQKNAEIDQHNEAETRRVEEAEARNAQAVLDAAAANDEIDKANTEEKARVEEHNRAEDEKAEASAIARKAAEEENESIRAYNEEAAKAAEKYAEDYAKYEADSKQYEYDVEMEKRILNAGYASVQDYNDRINKAYNEPAKKSVEMNAKSTLDDVSKTYVGSTLLENEVFEGEVAARMADRSGEVEAGYVNASGIKRGDDALNDWYAFMNVSIGVNLETLLGWTRSKRCKL